MAIHHGEISIDGNLKESYVSIYIVWASAQENQKVVSADKIRRQ